MHRPRRSIINRALDIRRGESGGSLAARRRAAAPLASGHPESAAVLDKLDRVTPNSDGRRLPVFTCVLCSFWCFGVSRPVYLSDRTHLFLYSPFTFFGEVIHVFSIFGTFNIFLLLFIGSALHEPPLPPTHSTVFLLPISCFFAIFHRTWLRLIHLNTFPCHTLLTMFPSSLLPFCPVSLHPVTFCMLFPVALLRPLAFLRSLAVPSRSVPARQCPSRGFQ